MHAASFLRPLRRPRGSLSVSRVLPPEPPTSRKRQNVEGRASTRQASSDVFGSDSAPYCAALAGPGWWKSVRRVVWYE